MDPGIGLQAAFVVFGLPDVTIGDVGEWKKQDKAIPERVVGLIGELRLLWLHVLLITEDEITQYHDGKPVIKRAVGLAAVPHQGGKEEALQPVQCAQAMTYAFTVFHSFKGLVREVRASDGAEGIFQFLIGLGTKRTFVQPTVEQILPIGVDGLAAFSVLHIDLGEGYSVQDQGGLSLPGVGCWPDVWLSQHQVLEASATKVGILANSHVPNGGPAKY